MPLNQAGNDVPFPPVPNVIKLAMKFTNSLDIDVVVNTHWQYTGAAPGTSGLATFLANVNTACGADLAPLYGTWVKYVQGTATDLTSASAGQSVATANVIGTRAGALLPTSTCALAVMSISRRYRGGKPRNYWPFGTDTDLQDGSHWTTAAQTAFNNGMAAFSAAVAVATGPATITGKCNVSFFQKFHSVQNPVTGRWRNVPTLGPSPPYPIVDPSQAYNFSLILGSQRRRNRPG